MNDLIEQFEPIINQIFNVISPSQIILMLLNPTYDPLIQIFHDIRIFYLFQPSKYLINELYKYLETKIVFIPTLNYIDVQSETEISSKGWNISYHILFLEDWLNSCFAKYISNIFGKNYLIKLSDNAFVIPLSLINYINLVSQKYD